MRLEGNRLKKSLKGSGYASRQGSATQQGYLDRVLRCLPAEPSKTAAICVAKLGPGLVSPAKIRLLPMHR
ncbi:hypothetical protein MRX96_027048 [Rhipicephalus microplus]